MTAPKTRPALGARESGRDAKERRAALDTGIALTVDGVRYEVRQGDLTGLDVRALRREVGCSFMGLSRELSEDPDVDSIAALMWLARRQAGETTLAYKTVAESLGYDLDIGDVVSGDLGEEEDPEA